ncbi:MAG: hypothetical protein OXM55_08535, partial [Bdellovibrionales bacterium]|nr:hypothetical protein [Bdellovibrionales bacterium]
MNILRWTQIFIVFSVLLIFLKDSPSFSDKKSLFTQQSQKVVSLTQNANTLTQRTISSTGVIRRGRVPVKETGSIQPQYENCKGKDIYKLNSEFQDRSDQKKTEASGSCIDCFISAPADDSISDIENTIHAAKDGNAVKGETKKSPYKSFKDQLRKRVLGQV